MSKPPDLSRYPTIDWTQYRRLLDLGVPAPVLAELMPIRVVQGVCAGDGRLEEAEAGEAFLAFEEANDIVLWCPGTGELTSWCAHAFALGEDNILNAGTYAFDNHLTIHADALDWLRDRCRGIVVLRWELAFDMLRDAPRIAVAERLLPLYRRHMTPRRLPEPAVLADDRRHAA